MGVSERGQPVGDLPAVGARGAGAVGDDGGALVGQDGGRQGVHAAPRQRDGAGQVLLGVVVPAQRVDDRDGSRADGRLQLIAGDQCGHAATS
jgi:hypothetical protein